MGMKARELARTVFDWGVVAKRMLGVYERIAGRTSNIEH
jgi:hypothetical protein